MSAGDVPLKRYERELASLGSAIDHARSSSTDLRDALDDIGRRPTVYVGSGGALAVARIAADLHRDRTGAPTEATTPLLAIQGPPIRDAAIVLFSSSAKNPDAAAVLAAARARQAAPPILITRRAEEDLPARIQRHAPRVVTIESPTDGFLATGSIAAMTTQLIIANGHHLPPTDELLDAPAASPDLRERVLVLHDWGLQNVARDIETRLSELGLAAVQMSDYRNFAHGRHVGLERNSDCTSIVALIDPKSKEIADRTLGQLPNDFHVVRLESPLTWPSSALHLLVSAFRLPLLLDAGDPAKPKVPAFGRKLYNLPIARALKVAPQDPVDRKFATSGHDRQTVSSALQEWLERTQGEVIGAVLLDYDGTCCTTKGRFEPPDATIQSELRRLLEAGVSVGFASGRGKSLPISLREWVPAEYWDQVLVGLYNGSVVHALHEDSPDCSEVPVALQSLADEINEALTTSVQLEPRSTQLTVNPTDGASGYELLHCVRTVLGRDAGRFKAFASGHSVDVVSASTSKVAVLDLLAARVGTQVLAIGDRGGIDGNDFEMLAATTTSLSVDSVSADLSRCWNLDERGTAGPELLGDYLKALRPRGGYVTFNWNRSA